MGDRKKKKTPLLETRKVKKKLAMRINTPPMNQPLITKAFRKRKQGKLRELGVGEEGERKGIAALVGTYDRIGHKNEEFRVGEEGGIAPLGGMA